MNYSCEKCADTGYHEAGHICFCEIGERAFRSAGDAKTQSIQSCNAKFFLNDLTRDLSAVLETGEDLRNRIRVIVKCILDRCEDFTEDFFLRSTGAAYGSLLTDGSLTRLRPDSDILASCLPPFDKIESRRFSLEGDDIGIVYFLFLGDKVVYVGQSSVGLARIYAHKGKKKFDSVSYISVPKQLLHSIEDFYIGKFKPMYNTDKNPRTWSDRSAEIESAGLV